MPPLRARFHFLNITNLEAVRQGAKPELVRWGEQCVPRFCSVVDCSFALAKACSQLESSLAGTSLPASPAANRGTHSRSAPAWPLNPDDLQQEVGPYVFQSVKVKRRVEFVRDGDAVRYHEYRYFLPLPELSNGSMDDPITTLNVPLVGELSWELGVEAGGLWVRPCWAQGWAGAGFIGCVAKEHMEACLACTEVQSPTCLGPPACPWPAGAVEVIGSLGVWKARRLLQMLAAWVERWGDPRVQGLFTTRTVGELLFGYE